MSTEWNKAAERRVADEMNKGHWGIVDERVGSPSCHFGLKLSAHQLTNSGGSNKIWQLV